MIKSIIPAAAFAVFMSGTAFATQPAESQQQSQAQTQGQSQSAKAKATSRSTSKANSSSRSTAKGGDASATSGDSSSSSDNSVGGDDINAWGFSYVDSAPQVPQGVIAEQMMITSQNIKVLGPIFGYAWQSINPTPAGLVSLAAIVQAASTNDQTDVGRSAQASTLATICTYKPELADARFGDGACDRIGEIVAATK